MTAEEMQAVARLPYIEIGSHTNSHADLVSATAEEAYRELVSSKAALEDLLKEPVSSFAYPFCRYSPECPGAAERAGYACAVMCEGRGGWRPYELSRESIASWDGRVTFALKSRRLGNAFLRSRLCHAALRARRHRRGSISGAASGK